MRLHKTKRPSPWCFPVIIHCFSPCTLYTTWSHDFKASTGSSLYTIDTQWKILSVDFVGKCLNYNRWGRNIDRHRKIHQRNRVFVKEEYHKGNVRVLFINLKKIGHKELDFHVIQRQSTCQFQSNIKDFLTLRIVKSKRKDNLRIRSIQIEVGRSGDRKPQNVFKHRSEECLEVPSSPKILWWITTSNDQLRHKTYKGNEEHLTSLPFRSFSIITGILLCYHTPTHSPNSLGNGVVGIKEGMSWRFG